MSIRTSQPRRICPRRRALAALVALLSLAAPMFAAPPAAAIIAGQTRLESQIAWAVKSLIVAERAAHHVGYIYMSKQLQTSAHRHDLAMARWNRMSHQLPGERYFSTRISQAGYHWSYAGENIAWTTRMSVTGALAMEKMMYGEIAPDNGHRLNILNRHYRDVGVDVYLDWRHHKLWLTTDFGHRR